jgi:hypothetical protein
VSTALFRFNYFPADMPIRRDHLCINGMSDITSGIFDDFTNPGVNISRFTQVLFHI